MTTAAEREAKGPKMNTGVQEPPLRVFMDDLTLTTTTHMQARWTLAALEDTI